MTKRGRLTTVPAKISAQKAEILEMYYDKGMKQQEIKVSVGASSVSEIAELLRTDMEDRIKVFKTLKDTSSGYEDKFIELVLFLRNQRKMTYQDISLKLDVDKVTIFNMIHSSNSKVRIAMTNEEKRERNELMKQMSIDGISLTEIGKRMGISKQMVSRIFAEIGYKPIRGTRFLKSRASKNTPELTKHVIEDCNGKLAELATELAKFKSKYTSSKQYTSKVIVELRCALVKEICKNVTLDNWDILQTQRKLLLSLHKEWSADTNEKAQFALVNETVELLKRTEKTTAYIKVRELIKK